VAVGAFALIVGVRPAAIEGVALAATRGVSGPPVRLVARVGFTGGGGGRPGAVRSDDIAGLRGYRGEYIEGRTARAAEGVYRQSLERGRIELEQRSRSRARGTTAHGGVVKKTLDKSNLLYERARRRG
jgi:hypothetical protein